MRTKMCGRMPELVGQFLKSRDLVNEASERSKKGVEELKQSEAVYATLKQVGPISR